MSGLNCAFGPCEIKIHPKAILFFAQMLNNISNLDIAE